MNFSAAACDALDRTSPDGSRRREQQIRRPKSVHRRPKGAQLPLEFRTSDFESLSSLLHLLDVIRLQSLQKTPRRFLIEFRIIRFNAEEEASTRCARELGHGGHRMIRARKSAPCERSEKAQQRTTQNRQLERDGNVHRPTVQGTAANVHGPINAHRVPAEEVAPEPACDSPNEK